MTTGEAFLDARLDGMRVRIANGDACEVAFDLDNTLFDTRARTAWIAREFDRERNSSHFASLTLDAVGLDAAETCCRMGITAVDVVRDFMAFWLERFWDGASFEHDLTVASVLSWAQRARDVGAKVCFLTGRVESLRKATEAQLRRAGFHDASPGALWMKPDVSTRTLEFKAQMLEGAMKRAWVGWYATEGREEIVHLQRELPGGPWVLVDCSLQAGGKKVAEGTPTLTRTF